MKLYLVYEFVNHNYDEDLTEEVEFIGIYRSIREAKRIANERVEEGIASYCVELAEGENKNNPFAKTNCVEMCRVGRPETTIYSICIKKLKLGGKV